MPSDPVSQGVCDSLTMLSAPLVCQDLYCPVIFHYLVAAFRTLLFVVDRLVRDPRFY